MESHILRTGLAVISSVAMLATTAAAQPAPAPLFNWSGFYLGAHADYSWGGGDVETVLIPAPAPYTAKVDLDGWGGGLRAGYDVRSGNWVAGLVADLSLTNIQGDGFIGPFLPVPGGSAGGSFHDVSQTIDKFGTLRARVGILATERMLAFVSGGLSFGRVNLSSDTFYGPFITRFVASETKWNAGWTVGGGAEWSLGSGWAVLAEYLYYDLGKTTVLANPSPPGSPGPLANRWKSEGHIVRFGLNYRFGG
jgi:outer membrane immunogenic protein